MNATSTLPENYRQTAGFNMKERGLLIKLNLAGLALLVLFGWLFSAAALWIRPEKASVILQIKMDGLGSILMILALVVLMFLVMVVHEVIHGLGFLLLAGVRPSFAFKGFYAYAAAPGWFIPRNPYLVIGLAPLMVISLTGILLMAVVPAAWVGLLVLLCVFNASGAVGDLWVAWLLLRQPPDALAQDMGDEIRIYTPDMVVGER